MYIYIYTIGNDENINTCCIYWSTLQLEKNEPKLQGRVNFYQIQVIKEHAGNLQLLNHEGKLLLEVKLGLQNQQDLKYWLYALDVARAALGSQIEEEASIANGTYEREKRLERLELRQKERENMKKSLGLDIGSFTLLIYKY